ncbi:hypothetical protein Hanom_Chr05g00451381 [Helianthus anomalus]
MKLGFCMCWALIGYVESWAWAFSWAVSSNFHSVICEFYVCFMAEIRVFYDFLHFLGNLDFLAEPHPTIVYY